MISWFNPIIVWMYLIYMASSVIASLILIGYGMINLMKKIKQIINCLLVAVPDKKKIRGV